MKDATETWRNTEKNFTITQSLLEFHASPEVSGQAEAKKLNS